MFVVSQMGFDGYVKMSRKMLEIEWMLGASDVPSRDSSFGSMQQRVVSLPAHMTGSGGAIQKNVSSAQAVGARRYLIGDYEVFFDLLTISQISVHNKFTYFL